MFRNQIIKYPVPMIRRLPAYLRVVKEFELCGEEYISATYIARELELDPIKVRKDIGLTKINGKPRLGYNVKELKKVIHLIIGWGKNSEAILVGAGSLGTALLGFKEFSRSGLNFKCAFDNNPDKINKSINGCEVKALNEMEEYIRIKKIEVAVLTVPARVAQETADKLIKAGIKGIWNFSPVKLKVPEEIIAQSENLMVGLAIFMVRMATG